MLRHKKKEVLKTDEVPVAFDNEAAMQHEEIAAAFPSSKLAKAALDHREGIFRRLPADKKYVKCKIMNTLQQNVDLAALTGQKLSSKTFFGEKVKTEPRGEVSETTISLQRHDINTVSSLRRPSETFKRQKIVKESSPRVQHVHSETISKAAESYTVSCPEQNDELGQITDLESLQPVSQNIHDASAQIKCPMALARQNFKSLKSNNQKVPTWRNVAVTSHDPSATAKPAKDVGATIYAVSESSTHATSLSPTLHFSGQNVHEHSGDVSLTNHKQTMRTPKGVTQRQTQVQSMENVLDSGSVAVSVSNTMSSHRHKTEHGHKNLTTKTVLNRVTRKHGWDLSTTSSYTCNRATRLNAGEISSEVNSSLSPASSKSDISVCEAQKLQALSVSQTSVKVNKSSTTMEKKREVPTASFRKFNVNQRSEIDSKKDRRGKETCSMNTGGFTRRDMKPNEVLRPTEKSKHDLEPVGRNSKLRDSVVSHYHRSSEKKVLSSKKLNEGKKTAEIKGGENKKIEVAVSSRATFSKAARGECKEDNEAITNVRTRKHCSNFVCDKSIVAQKVATAGGEKSRIWETSMDKLDGATNDKVRPNLKDLPLHDAGGTDCDSTSTDTRKLKLLSDISLSTELRGFEKIMASLDGTNSLEPSDGNDAEHIRNMAQFKPDVNQDDFLPVICFYWRKRGNTSLDEESHGQKGQQIIVSLDQGLSVLKKIMQDITAENNVCANEYMLSQCSGESEASAASAEYMNSSEYGLAMGNYFQLTPRTTNMQSSQVNWPADWTNHSQISSILTTASRDCPQDAVQTKLFEISSNTSGEDSSTLNDQISQCKDLRHKLDTSGKQVRSLQGTNSEDHDKQKSNLSYLWSLLTKGIITFFLNSVDKKKITYAKVNTDAVENNGPARDEPSNSLQNEQTSEDSWLQQEKLIVSVSPSKQCKSDISHGDIILECSIAGQSTPSDDTKTSEKQHSEGEMTCIVDIVPQNGHKTSDTRVIAKSNSAPAEKNKSELKEVMKVYLRKRSTGNRVKDNRRQTNTVIENEKSVDPQDQILDMKVVSDHRMAAGQDHHHPLDNSEKSNVNFGSVSEVCKKTVEDFQNVSVDHKADIKFPNSSSVYSTGSCSDDRDGKEINIISICQDKYAHRDNESHAAECDAFVVPELEQGSCHILHQEHQMKLAASSENCPDPDLILELSSEETDSLLTARLSGFVAANLKQYPHLVWTWRWGVAQQENECPQTTFQPSKSALDELMETGNRNGAAQLTEQVEIIQSHENFAESTLHKESPSENNSCVKDYIAERIKYFFSTDNFYNNSHKTNTAQTAGDVMNDRIHDWTEHENATYLAATPTRVFNETENTETTSRCSDHRNYFKPDMIEASDLTRNQLASSTNMSVPCKSIILSEGISEVDIITKEFKQNITDIAKPRLATIETEQSVCCNNLAGTALETDKVLHEVCAPEKLNAPSDAIWPLPDLKRPEGLHDKPAESEYRERQNQCSEQETGVINKEDAAESAEGQYSSREFTFNVEEHVSARNSDYSVSDKSNKAKTANYETGYTTINTLMEHFNSPGRAEITPQTLHQSEMTEIPAKGNCQKQHSQNSQRTEVNVHNQLTNITDTSIPLRSPTLPRRMSEVVISPHDSENTVRDLSIPCQVTTQNVQLWDDPAQTALVLKHASTSNITYVPNKLTAMTYSDFIRVGCSRPFGVNSPNLTMTLQLKRFNELDILPECGTSVCEHTLKDKECSYNVMNMEENPSSIQRVQERTSNFLCKDRITYKPQETNSKGDIFLQAERADNSYSKDTQTNARPFHENAHFVQTSNPVRISLLDVTTESRDAHMDNVSNIIPKEEHENMDTCTTNHAQTNSLLILGSCQAHESGTSSSRAEDSPPPAQILDVDTSKSVSVKMVDSFNAAFVQNTSFSE